MELLGSCLRSERWKARGSELGQLALQAIEFVKYSFTVHKKVVVAENQSYSSISKTSRKLHMFTVDDNRYINDSSRRIQLKIRNIPHYKSPQRLAGFVKLPQKAANLIGHILFLNPRLKSVLNICQQGVNYYTLWRRIYLNRDTLQSLMYITPKINAFKAWCFT